MQNRKPIRKFEDLYVWQLGIEMVKRVYLLTGVGQLKRDFGLKDQMRRAAVSVPTNIAEGFERFSRKEYLMFLNVAKASAGELRSLFRVALEIDYMDEDSFDELHSMVTKLSCSLSNQMVAIRNRS